MGYNDDNKLLGHSDQETAGQTHPLQLYREIN